MHYCLKVKSDESTEMISIWWIKVNKSCCRLHDDLSQKSKRTRWKLRCCERGEATCGIYVYIHHTWIWRHALPRLTFAGLHLLTGTFVTGDKTEDPVWHMQRRFSLRAAFLMARECKSFVRSSSINWIINFHRGCLGFSRVKSNRRDWYRDDDKTFQTIIWKKFLLYEELTVVQKLLIQTLL